MKIKVKLILTVITFLLIILFMNTCWRPKTFLNNDYLKRDLSNKLTVVNTIQKQLSNFKKHLINWKITHNAYPDNNLGLAILNDCLIVDQVLFATMGDEDNSEIRYAYLNKTSLDADNPRVHFLDKPFIGWHIASKPISKNDPNNCLAYHGEYSLIYSDHDTFFLLNDDVPVDPFMLLPYLYENRRAALTASFNGSLVNQDVESRYSMCVDEGVYIYSTTGEHYARECERLEQEIRKKEIQALFIPIAFHIPIILYLLQMWRSPRSPLKSYLFVVFIFYYFLLSILAPALKPARCAWRNDLRITRSPDVVQTQKQIIQSCYQEHIITKATCDKQLELLKLKLYHPEYEQNDCDL